MDELRTHIAEMIDEITEVAGTWYESGYDSAREQKAEATDKILMVFRNQLLAWAAEYQDRAEVRSNDEVVTAVNTLIGRIFANKAQLVKFLTGLSDPDNVSLTLVDDTTTTNEG